MNGVDTGPPSSYDEVPYGNECFRVTHPDHLAALALVHGVPAAPVERCRVLELGCARGGNLLPMALELPEASFVGVDLSTRQVETAREAASRLGLRNVELHAMDLSRIDASFGRFDYVVCHGVYSWVPDAVRERILGICRENLAPCGLVYVSYNTFPGWHERRMVRELMLYHARGDLSAAERLERARSFPRELGGVILIPSSPYAGVLRAEVERLEESSDSYLFHEFLEDENEPCYVHEFLARAARHGLSFVAEASLPGIRHGLPAHSREAISRWADDVASREQYLDFICNQSFRRTVLRSGGDAGMAVADAHAIAGLSASTDLVPMAPGPVVADDAEVEFRRPGTDVPISTNGPLFKAILGALVESSPCALSFGALLEDVRSHLVAAGRPLPEDAVHGAQMLCEALLQLFQSDIVELHVRPPRPAAAISACPAASPLARLQAGSSRRVTSLRRRGVDLEDFDRAVLLQLDGTRSSEDVVHAIEEGVLSGEFELESGGERVRDPSVIRAFLAGEVASALRRFRDSGLLAG